MPIMYRLSFTLRILALYCFTNIGHAIIFDASCATYQTPFLERAFTNAFLSAANGAAQLGPDKTVTDDPDINNLATWLFGPGSNYQEAYTRLNGVSQIPKTFTTDKTDISNANNIVVYCNFNRFVTPNPPRAGFLYDPDTGTYQAINDQDFQACKTGTAAIGNTRPKAITNSYTSLDLRAAPVLTTMDICPWYIQQVAQQQWRLGSDLNIVGVLGQLANFASSLFSGNTDMDTFAIFDYTILHELTHSRACGITQSALREPEAYGWNACVNAKSPSNSESLAMVCLGTDKIQLGYTVLEDGTVLTASQVDEMAPPVSPSSRSGHSSGASSPGVDDPDSPAPGSGSTSPGKKRELGMTAKKGAIHAERRFNA